MEDCPICGARYINVRNHVLNRTDMPHRHFVNAQRDKARGLLCSGMSRAEVERRVYFGRRWVRRIHRELNRE